MKDVIKIAIVAFLNFTLSVLAMLDIISFETFAVTLGSLLIVYYSFEFVGD